MQNISILNSKETKEILSLIEKQFGCKMELDYAFLKNPEDKIFIINKDLAKIDLSKLRINNLGIYIAQIHRGSIRLSIEGTQLIGPYATKNIVSVNKEQMIVWISGEDLEVSELLAEELEGFVILKYRAEHKKAENAGKDYFLGCGKIMRSQEQDKQDKKIKLVNYVSKSRRVNWVESVEEI